jgi:mycothiol synthase
VTEPISFSWTATPDPAEVTGLLDAVYAVDGRPAPEPDASLPGELRGGQHLFARRADAVVGYAHLNEGDAFGRPVAELFVRPPDRGAGIGAGLAAEVAARAGVSLDDPAADRLRAWSHGDHPAAAGLARRLGFERVRELLRMRRALPGPDEPEFNGPALALPTLPEGVRLRAFVPGQDEAAVVAVNHRAFDWHPEQGAMTEDEVREAETEPWFDPAGFLLAVDASDKLLGFHWTKVHAHGAVGDQPGVPMGEVYVVGVDPAAQGGGLGRALTVAGLRHLADKRGLDRVMLYTEGDNTPAIRLYERLGFARWDSDVQYAH